ncbi:H-type small acid-soluble spore protein [Oceanobacillus halophilus]|uniref:Small, acid-soluble spore protein H n=1 Tax=Oceanobacillus halophilus TaxID=930130 RepID=A0A495A241_9BACI|nr:H-type small acid-soluble spore protein [Oceanobacillus halophilus]RKQ33550.1 H-type small acid-soluble spore protein [Oceanobacillus halophilus]
MDKQRAKEIAQSDKIIPVTYRGRNVYLKNIDEQTEIAKVLPLDNLNSEFSVELSNLEEMQ